VTHGTGKHRNFSKRFVVEPGTEVKLHKIDPGYIDPDVAEQDALAETKKLCKRPRKLQAVRRVVTFKPLSPQTGEPT
jgi:hypothetical protein